MKENQKKKRKIFLCDMVHNYIGAATYMFPLNVGFIAAFTNKFFSKEVEISLFKYPEKLLKEIKLNIPDIVGFSNYTWNADLNNRLSHLIKSVNPNIITVFGGPNINYSDVEINNFFSSHKDVDFYVPFQGEIPFVNLLKKAFEHRFVLAKIKKETIDGVFFYSRDDNRLCIGNRLNRIKNPDEIPSPYLTGLLDEFFNYNLIPIIETNRGCPYGCTFCAQGLSSYNSLEFFGMERIKSELDYIADHVKNTNLLNLADSNFGIVDRDIEIARHIANLYKNKGYPYRCSTNWAKNQPKVFEIAKILNNVNIIVSLQSLNNKVLNNIKRSNIKISVFKKITNKVNDLGAISGTEIILGLPGETKNSHLDTIRKLFDWNVSYIICYNGLILDGTELSSLKKNNGFKCKSKFRLIDSSFGKYNGILSFEIEEGILATNSMSQDELLSFRPIHWLIQFLWNYRFYYDLLKLLQIYGINPVDYIQTLIDNSNYAPSRIKEIFNEFKLESKNEWFDSLKELRKHYSKPENFSRLEQGLYGKMNGKYIFETLLRGKSDFEEYLLSMALSHVSLKENKLFNDFIRELLSFLSASIIDFSKSFDDIPKEKFMFFKFNIIKWRESKNKAALEKIHYPQGLSFRFYLSKDVKNSLKKLMSQYRHMNKNLTLRKMSEFMLIGDFFYRVEMAS